MTILCTIDLLTREVFLPADQRIAAYDHNVDIIHFQAEPVGDFSFDLSSIRIAAKGPNKARHDYPVDPSTVSIEEETGYITFDWPIPQGVTEMPEDMFGYGSTGQLIFAVCAEIISGSALSKAWHSDDGIITVVAHLEPESGGGEDPSEEATNAQKIGQLQTDMAVVQRAVAAVAGGTPTVVDAKADMTDTNKIYVLSTDGKWYYHDGTTWTAGGTYGGTVTDTTLSISGAPADAKAVGDALADFTIEVDDTLTEQGKAADAKAVGDALTLKADSADVEAEINSLDERVATLESGGDDVPYEERGDLYDLFVSAEVVEMRKTDYRMTYNASSGAIAEQSYAAGHPSIFYIDTQKLGYERLWIHAIAGNVWSVLADYDPAESTYTLLTVLPNANTGKLVTFSTIPEGHYLAVSVSTANWKTGLLCYLGRVWIKPEYAPKHDGWDVPVSNEPIPCELYPVSMGYPAIYIDMEKYRDRLVRLINSGTMYSTATYGIRAYTDLAGTSYVDATSFFSIGNFSAWIYPGQYIVLFYRGKITENTLNLTMGYVPVENALKYKQQKKWGPKIAFHNVDTRNEMIFACAVGSIFDIDVCRTLDGKFVCIHNTTINGHTIAQTNLEDLELTYNQMEVTDAFKLMREYGVINFFNFREATPAQVLELVERAYNYLGDTIAYDSNITESGSELANHLDKYYTWLSGSTLDALIGLGARKGRIFAWISALEGTDYNVADIIVCKSVESGKTLSTFEWDGECAVLWVNSDTPGFVRG